MTQIQLTIPAPDREANPNTLLQPQELNGWLEELPIANPLGTAKLLLKSLWLLNRHPDPLPNRAELMYCYMPSINSLVTQLRKSKNKSVSGKSHRNELELGDHIDKITTEISYGFKRTINETNLLQNGKLDSAQQAHILYFAIKSLSLELLTHFSNYQKEPGNCWREIVQIYLLSERLGVSQQKINDPQHPADIPLNVRHAFKSILLVILLDPFHLQEGELWIAHRYLGWWAQHALISKIDSSAKHGSGCFLVDLQGSQKPRKFDPGSPPENPSQYMLLDCEPLNVIINKQMKSLDSDKAEQIPGMEKISPEDMKRLLRHMLIAWHIHPGRKHPRAESYGWLIAASGVNDISHFLGKGRLAPSPQAETDQDLDEINILELADPFGTAQPVEHHTFRWRQINESLSGMGIEAPLEDEETLQVGQLILVENERTPGEGKWSVGVIRRIIHKDQETLEIGIQFVQGRINSATIRPVVFGTLHRADFQPALMLDRGKDHPGTLFTPHLIYHFNREYVVDAGKGKTMRIYADKLLETTCCYDRFEYRIINLHGSETE